MRTFDIILKQYNLTDDEYYQLYERLMVDDVLDIPFNKPLIDRAIRKLKYRNKSSIKTLSPPYICTQKFKYKRVLNVQIDAFKNIIPMVNGSNAHLIPELVWDLTNEEEILNHINKGDFISFFSELCNTIIPEYDRERDFYKHAVKVYTEYEYFRISKLLTDYGIEKSKGCILPAFRELRIENETFKRAGIVDVIYKFPDNTYKVMDYKFGYPHYCMEKFYENKYNCNVDQFKYVHSDILFEIGEYAYKLLFGDANEIYECDGVQKRRKLSHLIITHGCVLYMFDWKNTLIYHPIDDYMFEICNKYNNIYINKINSGFNRKINRFCLYCEFIFLCSQSKEWKNIEKNVKKLI